MEKTFTIYKHTNKINGKVYIGQTNQVPKYRWGGKGQNYKNAYFASAIEHYGWENFEHEILETNLTMEEANEHEQYWISFYKSNNPEFGYNSDLGGKNKVPNEQSRAKMSKSAQNRPNVTDTTKQKLSDIALGRKYSDDIKQHYSDAAKKREQNKREQNIKKYRMVKCIETGTIFSSIAAAAKWCGLVGSSGIALACNNKNRTAGVDPKTSKKLHWEYTDRFVLDED